MNTEIITKYVDNNINVNNILDYQMLINMLKNANIDDKDLKKILPTLKINDDEIILISDTHYGSIYDNYDYIKIVYDFASKNNIKTIIHGGDFIQGTYAPLRNPNQSIFGQMEEVLHNYPHDNNIHNYVLLGNHDYLLVRKSLDKTIEYFDMRNDISTIGLKQTYIDWKNYLIFLYHSLPKIELYNYKVNCLIKLYGHRHEYNYTDSIKKIYLPTLSDDVKYYGNVVYPGFIKMKLDDEALEIQYYPIANNKIYDTNIVLRKELKYYDYLNK